MKGSCRTYLDVKLLFLDGLVGFQVGALSIVQLEFQLGDLSLHLLLDASHFGLQLNFGIGQTSAQSLDFDGQLFPVKKKSKEKLNIITIKIFNKIIQI